MDTRDRSAAGAAIASAALSVAVVALVIAGLAHGGGSEGRAGDATDRSLAVALGAVLCGLAIAQARVALAADGVLRPASWVSRLGLAAALAGAAVQFAGGAVSIWQEARGVHGPLATVLVEIAPAGIGAWALCTAAAAWRIRVWPQPLRVVGAVFGASAMIQPGAPPLAAVALLAGLVWWIGLAREWLRPARSTGG